MSQRDVPGMTQSALPLLAAAGIRVVSVGVNGGSTPPNVARVFDWAMPGDSAAGMQSAMRMMYLEGGYGGVHWLKPVFIASIAPGLSHALVVGEYVK